MKTKALFFFSKNKRNLNDNNNSRKEPPVARVVGLGGQPLVSDTFYDRSRNILQIFCVDVVQIMYSCKDGRYENLAFGAAWTTTTTTTATSCSLINCVLFFLNLFFCG